MLAAPMHCSLLSAVCQIRSFGEQQRKWLPLRPANCHCCMLLSLLKRASDRAHTTHLRAAAPAMLNKVTDWPRFIDNNIKGTSAR